MHDPDTNTCHDFLYLLAMVLMASYHYPDLLGENNGAAQQGPVLVLSQV